MQEDEVRRNLDRHLLEGTTTLINMDGFALLEEVERARAVSPLRIELTTVNTPANLQAALLADGSGLTEAHKANKYERMLGAGATVLGEIGAGATLGGMGQDYLYIPRAIREATGVDLQPVQARRLKEAILGTYIDPGSFDAALVAQVISEIGLEGRLSVEEARDIVAGCVMPCFQTALDGIAEAARMARDLDLPMIVHNAASSKRVIREVCRELAGEATIVLAHSNHSTFLVDEAVEHARANREAGAVIDITSGDFYGARRLFQSPEITFELLRAGVVDVISTDYMGGFHDPILLVLEKAIDAGVIDLPGAISLATGNAAGVFPKSLGGRGRLEKGKLADLVITADHRISRVDTVIIDGRVVVRDGKKLAAGSA